MMRVNCIMHVAEEGPAAIGDWAKKNEFSMDYTRLFAGDDFPAMEAFDFLLVMGGPMSYDDDAKYDWMTPEKEFVRLAIDADKCVLGICLGAQIITEALGSGGRHQNSKEIGWFPVQFNTSLLADMGISNPKETQVIFHWHSDTFEIPSNAVKLASTQEFPNQAFLYKDRVLGLQFHLEATKISIETMVEAFGYELVKDQFIQTDEEILSMVDNIEHGNKLLYQLLDFITKNHRKAL